MSILFHIGNTLILPLLLSITYNYYKFHGREIHYRRLWVSMAILSSTMIVSTLQFIFPEIIPALNRNGDALRAGEFWRLFSPLFIQPFGIRHCVINFVLFFFTVPLAEHFYGRGQLPIYFGAGLVGQLFSMYWDTTPGGMQTAGGGSSPGIYGTMGALFAYVLVYRRRFPKGYIWLAIPPFVGAAILITFEDGHAPSLLAGALIAFILCKVSPSREQLPVQENAV
jgi:hypothetical protein